tara:strand:- start:4982 stop:5509 length:528 start_codon:yes stop_codon:yes gene_type:complete
MIEKAIGTCVLSADQIDEGVKCVAAQLNGQFKRAVVVVVVPGGIFFSADLLRQLNFDVVMETISCPHTPGERHNPSPIVFHPNVPLAGEDIILVDDAIESGGTMKRLVAHLRSHYAVNSISVATLFVKPGRVAVGAQEYYGMAMQSDELLVGYGLPWAHKNRNLPYIARLKNISE